MHYSGKTFGVFVGFIVIVISLSHYPFLTFYAPLVFVHEQKTILSDNELQDAKRWLSRIDENDVNFTSALQALVSVLEYPHDREAANDDMVDGSLSRYGHQTRLDLVMTRLLFPSAKNNYTRPGSRIRFACIGGSVTSGYAIGTENAYCNRLNKWMDEAFQHINVTSSFHNVALGATNSHYFSMCISENMNLKDYDVLFIEFLVNDITAPGTNEELIRTIWRINPMLHVIQVHFRLPMRYFGLLGYPPGCANESYVNQLYHKTEDHYHITAIQWHHVIESYKADHWPDAERKLLAGNFTAPDWFHPNEFVHRQMTQFIISYFKRSFSRLLARLAQEVGSTKAAIAMMADDERAIMDETSKAMESPPVFATTWVDAVDCFASIERPFSTSKKLTTALRRSSSDAGVGDLNLSLPKYVAKGKRLDSEVKYFSVPNNGSYLSFNFTEGFQITSPCRKDVGYVPRLAIAYRLCNDCPFGILLFDVRLLFTDKTFLNVSFTVQLQNYGHNGNQIDVVDAIYDGKTVPVNRNGKINAFENELFCQLKRPMIESMDVDLLQQSQAYQFLLHGIVVVYKCCSK